MAFERIRASVEARQDRKDAAGGDFIRARSQPEELDAARPLDALITDDREILGDKKDSLFRDRYRHIADVIDTRIEKAEERVIKPDDTVDERQQKKYRREKYLEYRNNRADAKIARLQEKIDNSPKSTLSKYINHQRKQTINILNRNKSVFDHQQIKLEQKRQNKPEQLKKKIDQLVNRKIEAMYRRELRKRRLLDQDAKGIGKYDIVKRAAHKAEFIAKMKSDEKKRIVREAILLVRKQNIEKGRLEPDYGVDDTLDSRKVTEHYGRTIE